jgi:hypothetical protein
VKKSGRASNHHHPHDNDEQDNDVISDDDDDDEFDDDDDEWESLKNTNTLTHIFSSLSVYLLPSKLVW